MFFPFRFNIWLNGLEREDRNEAANNYSQTLFMEQTLERNNIFKADAIRRRNLVKTVRQSAVCTVNVIRTEKFQ